MINLLKSSSLSKLSSEILKVSFFARGLIPRRPLPSQAGSTAPLKQRRNDQLMNFLISLDFLVKGLLSHWQIKLSESATSKGKSTELMKGLDIKFPILIGD